MVYTPFTNWKYDKSLYHPVQSGPQRTGSDLNLTDTYLTFSSGYVTPSGISQTYEAVLDEGADFGRIPVGPPNISGYFDTEWRAVTPAVSGYWTNYENTLPHASGLLDSYVGFRAQGLYKTANSTVQTAIGPQPGLRNFGSFTWYGEQVPDNQLYSPFQTPGSNDNTIDGGGITGGGVSQPRVNAPALTNPTNDTTGSRAAWVYHYPVYCQSFIESRYTGVPGLYKTANSTVQTAIGPQPGLRNFGSFTWYGEQVPDNQLYSPFQTPGSNDNTIDGGGITGGGVSQPRVNAPALTNPTNDTTGSRAAWVYHYPVYCQSFIESRYTGVPGQMGSPVRNSYRGKSSRYVPNYGSIYGKLGEGVRNMIRTFSPGTNL